MSLIFAWSGYNFIKILTTYINIISIFKIVLIFSMKWHQKPAWIITFLVKLNFNSRNMIKNRKLTLIVRLWDVFWWSLNRWLSLSLTRLAFLNWLFTHWQRSQKSILGRGALIWRYWKRARFWCNNILSKLMCMLRILLLLS